MHVRVLMTPVWLFTDFSFIKWNDDIYFNRQYGAVFFFISETVVFQDWETPDPYISPLFFSNHKEEIFRRSEWLFEKKIGAFVRFSKQFAQLVFFGLSTLRFFPCVVASKNPSLLVSLKIIFLLSLPTSLHCLILNVPFCRQSVSHFIPRIPPVEI